jgi:hypothetical protein
MSSFWLFKPLLLCSWAAHICLCKISMVGADEGVLHLCCLLLLLLLLLRQAFLDVHSTAVAAEGLSPTKASINDGMGGAKLAARLSPLKDADSSQVCAAFDLRC